VLWKRIRANTLRTDTTLRFLDQEKKERILRELLQRLFAYNSYANPFLKFRKDLVEVVLGFA